MSADPVKEDEHILERFQFSNLIRCPECGETGVVTWEENVLISNHGPQLTLVRLSPEFSERMAQKAPHAIELVCRRCGTAQAE